MRFRLHQTEGGPTVFDAEAGECFKSRHNALREVEEVFYRPGVAENPWRASATPFRVLELGFGLGTNFLHLRTKTDGSLELVSIERDFGGAEFFLKTEPNEPLSQILREGTYREGSFSARLERGDFFERLPALARQEEKFHTVYFDPFSPKANPDAWTESLFRLAYDLLLPQGRLVTYSVSRVAKDGAARAGFTVFKRALPAELQKRNALLAVKEPSP